MGEWISDIQGWTDREVRAPAIFYRNAAQLIYIHAND
jgi:hypothetical protein